MNEEDAKQLSAELCRRWKGKLTRDDLAYWARELDGHRLSDIIDALTRFKNSSRFVPKVAEIKKLLPYQTQPGDGKPKDEGSFADVLRRQNRQFEGRLDAEVYLRYYRQLWVAYGSGARDLEVMTRKLTGECIINLCQCGYDEKQAKHATDFFYGSADMFRNLLEEIRNGVSQPTEHQFT